MDLKRSATTASIQIYNYVMLTHSINIYKSQPIISSPMQQQPRLPVSQVVKKSKFEYNVFLGTIPFKKGGYVLSQTIEHYDKLSFWAIYLVKDIQEIHYLCEYDQYNNPLCLHLENLQGTHNFWGAVPRWKFVPNEVLDRFGITDGTFDANAHY